MPVPELFRRIACTGLCMPLLGCGDSGTGSGSAATSGQTTGTSMPGGGSTDATPTDATPTDATPTDATPTEGVGASGTSGSDTGGGPAATTSGSTGGSTDGSTADTGSTGDPVEPPAGCGDCVVDGEETCDDGNHLAGDGCSPLCQYEGAFTCGNGVLEAPERCDDGNQVVGDGCEPSCNHTPGQVLWHHIYGNSNGDRGHSVATDSKGNILAAGVTHNSAEFPNRQASWLRKLTPEGDTVWTQLHASGVDGPFNWDEALAVAVDGEDSVVVSGLVTTPGQSLDLWVAKYGQGSPLLWEHTRDGPGGGGKDFDRGYGIAVGPDDHVVAVGQYTMDNNIDWDWWIGKFAPSGEPVWEQTVSDATPARALAVEVDSTGGIAVVGLVAINGGTIGEAHLRYYDPDGQLVWDTIVLPIGTANALAIDPDDNILVIGYENGWEGNTDLWIGKYSPAGDKLWAKTYATPPGPNVKPTSLARGITTDACGNFAIHSGPMAWLGKFTTDGELLWEWWNPENYDYAGDVAFDRQGYLATVGSGHKGATQFKIYVRRFTP